MCLSLVVRAGSPPAVSGFDQDHRTAVGRKPRIANSQAHRIWSSGGRSLEVEECEMPEIPFYGTAGQVMTRKVVTVTPDTSIRAAAKLMAANHISGVPVVDNAGRLLGVVSEADLLRSRQADSERESWWLNMLAEGEKLAPEFIDFVRTGNNMVRTVMHHDIAAVGEGTSLAEVAQMLVEKAVKRLPVVVDGRIVGIVSRADLVKALGARQAKDTIV
jgi:CBS domain-containing protein